MNNTVCYTAHRVFNGKEMLPHHGVITEGEYIKSVLPLVSINSDIPVIDFGNATIVPAFIDLQLYGSHGRLLAVYPDAQSVKEIYKYSANGGAAYCMPTVATNPYPVIFDCIDAIRDYWAKGGKGVLGLHVEGPWINPVKRGAHKIEWIFSPTVEQAKELLDYGEGVIKIITLAPELVSDDVIELIQSRNIVISAGHSNATYQEANNAFDKGIIAATHLYNAMSPLQHRAPGLVAACFNHPGVSASIIPDGHHVDYAAIQVAKKMMEERLFVITDSVTETTTGYYQHVFEGDKYTSNGILSGSALTMCKAVHNLVHYAGIALPEALRMCSLYPARVMNMSDKLGLIREGYLAKMAVLDENFNVLKLVD
ncbi:MAG TPA: N-acetylglucosamine-6-phosphate deacetylase [Chitinophagaceae bacterium]|nr:N-acetylglucosamine-6-phosphate deacetylase [Chitinophagaceae bacterium]